MKTLFLFFSLSSALICFSQNKPSYMGNELTELGKRQQLSDKLYFIEKYNNYIETDLLKKGEFFKFGSLIYFGMKTSNIAIDNFRDFYKGTSRKELMDGKTKEIVVSLYNKYDELFKISDTRTVHFYFEKDTLSQISIVYSDVSNELFYKTFNDNLIKVGNKYFENDYLYFYELSVDKYGNKTAQYTKTNKSNSPADIWQKAKENMFKIKTLEGIYDYKVIDPDRYKAIEDVISGFFKDNTNVMSFYNGIGSSFTGDSIKITFGQNINTTGDYYCVFYKISNGKEIATLDGSAALKTKVLSKLRENNFSKKDNVYVNIKSAVPAHIISVNSTIFFEVDKDENIKYFSRYRSGIEPADEIIQKQNSYHFNAKIKNANLKKGKYTATYQLIKLNGETKLDEFKTEKGWDVK